MVPSVHVLPYVWKLEYTVNGHYYYSRDYTVAREQGSVSVYFEEPVYIAKEADFPQRLQEVLLSFFHFLTPIDDAGLHQIQYAIFQLLEEMEFKYWLRPNLSFVEEGDYRIDAEPFYQHQKDGLVTIIW